jgi:hypothetical protein
MVLSGGRGTLQFGYILSYIRKLEKARGKLRLKIYGPATQLYKIAGDSLNTWF